MTMQLVERNTSSNSAEELIAHGIHPILAKLWATRGIQSFDQTSLELKHLIPPQNLKNCSASAVYLADALANQKNILIIADYDCDGATACAVGILGLEQLGKTYGTKIHFLVPNRFTMGYGLTPEVVDLAAQQTPKPDILITVDNGIASIAGVARANELGMEVIVTDHHLPADELPSAKLIINPNQPECTFSSKALAGVGVIFYILLALRAELRHRGLFDQETQPRLETLLDFVALGTVADVASLDRNNRILVSAGVRRMRNGQMHPGIQALFEASGRDYQKSNTFDLGFGLGPRLNAAGRLADMTLGIKCLISQDLFEARKYAKELDTMNRERREIEGSMQETALINLADISTGDTYSLCMFDTSWHQGVIGILASRLKDKYHRPVIVFAPGEETSPSGSLVLKGSGRSISGFHLRDAIDYISKKNPEMILKFGGHAMAAGLSIEQTHLASFQQAFESIAKDWIDEDTLLRKLVHDGELPYEMINAQLAEHLSSEIWGQGFPEPIFTGKFKVIKQSLLKEKHLKLELQALDGEMKKNILGIWFGHTELLPPQTHLAYRLLVDHYLGYPRAQVHIEAAFDSPT
jgi:single-stranded-DNA-specific exonuclease